MVVPDTPAEEAGLLAGDVIIASDGQEVITADDMVLAIRAHKVGDLMEITYLRDGEENTVLVTLVERPEA